MPIRNETGCRSYNTNDVARLRFIHFGKSAGFDIGEIRAVLEMAAEGNCEELDVMVAFTRDRINALERFCEALDRISTSIQLTPT